MAQFTEGYSASVAWWIIRSIWVLSKIHHHLSGPRRADRDYPDSWSCFKGTLGTLGDAVGISMVNCIAHGSRSQCVYGVGKIQCIARSTAGITKVLGEW
jgi:hypothetical protein